MMYATDDLGTSPASSIRSHDLHVEAIVKNLETCNSELSPSQSAQLDTNETLKVGVNENRHSKKFKVIFLGDSGVGKSAIMLRFSENRFAKVGVATLGLDISRTEVTIGNETVLICLWDTAGQEAHDAITESYCRDADGIIMVYDVTREKSFLALRRRWLQKIQQIREETKQKVVVLLIGNKTDMNPRKVRVADGQGFATEMEAEFFEMSAKSGDGADQAHTKLAKLLIQNEIDKLTKLMNSLDLEKPNATRKSSCFCSNN